MTTTSRYLLCLLFIAFNSTAFAQTFPGGNPVFSAASFDPHLDLSVHPGSIHDLVSMDLDGDGKPDLAGPSVGGDSIFVLRNTSTNGNITFAPALKLGNPFTYPYSIAAGDLDGDGKPDLVAGNEAGLLTIFRNTSTPGGLSFTNAGLFQNDDNCYHVFLADIDGDGKLDVVCTTDNPDAPSNPANLSVQLNTTTTPGTITLAPPVNIPIGFGNALTVGDIDGDGKPDVAIANLQNGYYGTILIFQNTSSPGNVSFTTLPALAPGLESVNLKLADLDGDGKPELISTDDNDSSAAIWLNQSVPGTITLGTMQLFPVQKNPWAISIGDFDGDGKPDLAVANTLSNLSANGSVSVLRNISTMGNLAFTPQFAYAVAPDPNALVATDLDGDGKTDLIAGNYGALPVSILRNRENEPYITSFAPLAAFTGATITIHGVNLTTTNTVTFGGTPAASFTVVSDTIINAVVGNGTTGSVALKTIYGQYSLTGFEYDTIKAPTISSFTPASGPVGATVTITGTNFNPTPSGNSVWFGATQATVTSATATSLKVTVPAGSSYKPITVTANHLTAYSQQPFIPTFSGVVNDQTTTSFAQPIQYGATNSTMANDMAVADFDGDGKPDVLLLGGQAESGFTIFSNTGKPDTALFTWHQPIDWYITPYHVSVGDIDGDGKPDVALAGGTGYGVIILKNTSVPGSISFSNIAHIPGSSFQYITNVWISDIDVDGKPDLVVPGTNRILVYRNNSTNGILSFADSIGFPVGNGIKTVAIGDLDGDGKPELISVNGTDNTISLLHNTSTASEISFGAKTDYPAGAGPNDAVIADFDGDGKPDLAVADAGNLPSYANTVYLFHNTSGSTPSFAAAATQTLVPWLTHLSAGDLDGDGKPDLLVISEITDSLMMLKNTSSTGSIAFSSPTYFKMTFEPMGITSDDVDGDGYPDILFFTSPINGFSVMKNHMNSGATTFVPPVITAITPTSGAIGSSVTITGQNFSTTPANNIVYFGQAGATVTAATASSLTVTVPRSGSFGPLTASRDQLTAMSSQFFDETFPHSGAPLSNNFLGTRTDLTATGGTAIAMADINGDGLVDLLTMENPATLAIYVNNGSSAAFPFNLSTTITFAYQDIPNQILVMDVDGNGKPDIVALDFGISVFLNTSTGSTPTFAAPVNLAAESCTNAVAGDFDGDGRLDLAIIGINGPVIYQNLTANNQVSFGRVATLYTYNAASGITVGDFDGDGKPDIVLTENNDNKVDVFYNRTVGKQFDFTYTLVYSTGQYPNAVATADFDGDGRQDFVVGNRFDTVVSIYRNVATGTFTRTDVKCDYGPMNIAVGDFNGDGLPDLAMDNFYDSAFYLLQNTSTVGKPSFAAPAGYATHGPTSSIVVGDYNGDGTPDIALATQDKNVVSLFPNQSQRPVITSFTPTTVSPGTTVTISGYNLTSTQLVGFGGVPATSFNIVSDNQITAVVGEGNENYVTATTAYGTDTLAGLRFAAPTITQVTPVTGALGTSLSITGTNFSAVPAHNIVYLGAVKATVTAASTTNLSVKVPAGSSLQQISVSTFGETGSANTGFDLTFANLGFGFNANDFAAKLSFAAGVSPAAIATGDLDGDGLVDAVAGNVVLRNTGGPGLVSFATAQGYGRINPNSPSSTVLDDINGDGKLDIIEVGNLSSMVSVFVNTSTPGNISFAPEADFPCTTGATNLTVADLDGDGKKDLVITPNFGPASISILKNTSFGSTINFQYDQSSVDIGGSWTVGSGIRDLDGDGKPDIVLVNNEQQNFGIYRNTSTPGTISFSTTPFTIQTYGFPNTVAIGDLDGDGKADLAVNTEPLLGYDNILVYKNYSTSGNFSFIQEAALSLGETTTTIAIGDWDGDGHPDIAAPGANLQSTIYVFRNLTTGEALTFAIPFQYTTDFQTAGIVSADLDGDGKPEIVTVNNSSSGTMAVLRNKQAEALIVPNGSNPAALPIIDQATVDTAVQTLNGAPYVPRHYDIQPVNNPSGATAQVTLYFTQADFDAFNASPNHGPDLPTSPTDAQGIANLRIYQYHGFSATGQPGTYSGNGVEIDPADSNIVWDYYYQYWTVTFDVTGFSGFFISSIGFNYNQTPAPVLHIQGAARVCQGDSVTLISSAAQGNQWYYNGSLITGATDPGYTTTVAGSYTATATNNDLVSPQSAAVTVEVDTPSSKPVITAGSGYLHSSSAAGNQWYLAGAPIAGATGQQFQPTVSGRYTVMVTTGTCPSLTSDAYNYQVSPMVRIDSVHYITMGPNPFHSSITLMYNVAGGGPLYARVMDTWGKVVYSFGGLSDGAQLDLAGLAPGIYVIELYTADGKQHYVIRLQKG